MDKNILQTIESFLIDDRYNEAYRLLDSLEDDNYDEAVAFLNEKDIFNIGDSYKNYLVDNGIPFLANNQEYHKIARGIEILDEDCIDYDLALLWSLAYTSMNDTERALEILDDYANQGQDDAVFHTRLSINYADIKNFEEATDEIEEALRIDPECEDALLQATVLYQSLGNTERSSELSTLLKELNPELWRDYFGEEPQFPAVYDEQEITCIENHIDRYFGHFENVLHEIVSPDIHVDLAIIPPNEERNYYTLVTVGMGACPMNIPNDFDAQTESRIELVMYLPPDWKLSSSDDYYFWPIRELKTLARFPIINETWLGAGHTVTNGEPFSKYSNYNGFILAYVANIDSTGYECVLPNGESVRFYQAVPLYEEELLYKIENGASSLLKKMIDFFPFVFDLNRPNICSDIHSKEWAIPKSCIIQVLDWEGPAGCFATDKIMVGGANIGFMYREFPNNEQDSGWRFMAGDESQDYMNDPNNVGIYHLNTLCNYDRDIMPLLNSPYNTAFRRDENGILVLDKRFGEQKS